MFICYLGQLFPRARRRLLLEPDARSPGRLQGAAHQAAAAAAHQAAAAHLAAKQDQSARSVVLFLSSLFMNPSSAGDVPVDMI